MYMRKNIVKNYLFFFLIFYSRSFSFIIVELFHGFFNNNFKFSDTEKVRNADFYKRCMKDALESLGNEVEEEDDDPFTL